MLKSPEKTVQTKTEIAPVYIRKSTKEFSAFIWYLEENFKKANSKSLQYQMLIHKEMNHTLLTPRYYRNEESFTLLASDNNRLTKEKDGSVSYQPFVTHQHIVQPDIQPKCMGIDINTEERKIKDISHLQSKMIRDQLIGERDIFTKYGYDEANELNEIISEIKTIKNTQKGVTNVIAQIGCHLDLLVQAAEANNISMNDN